MVTCHLQLKMKIKTEFPFLMYKLIAKIKHLQLLPTLNLLSVDIMHILTALNHLPIRLMLFTHLLPDASEHAQVEFNNL